MCLNRVFCWHLFRKSVFRHLRHNARQSVFQALSTIIFLKQIYSKISINLNKSVFPELFIIVEQNHKSSISIFCKPMFLSNIWTALCKKRTTKNKDPTWNIKILLGFLSSNTLDPFSKITRFISTLLWTQKKCTSRKFAWRNSVGFSGSKNSPATAVKYQSTKTNFSPDVCVRGWSHL